jgi:hypothetical protein
MKRKGSTLFHSLSCKIFEEGNRKTAKIGLKSLLSRINKTPVSQDTSLKADFHKTTFRPQTKCPWIDPRLPYNVISSGLDILNIGMLIVVCYPPSATSPLYLLAYTGVKRVESFTIFDRKG